MPRMIRSGLCILTGISAMIVSVTAYGQQISEREAFSFQLLNNPYALNRAIAIERVEDGFGDRNFVTNTTNDSTAVGTLTEIQALLEGDNSNVTLDASPTQTNSGTQTSTSDQDADVSVDN